jgi:hypothetical protein
MRYLLSHNHNIPAAVAPALTPAEFSAVFQTFLAAHLGEPGAIVQPIDHPHWRCAITSTAAPATMGQALGAALRQARQANGPIDYAILALGGLKTTPATAPSGLQPGEWGVDVVETLDVEAFLADLGWDQLIAGRSADELFQAIG